MYFYDVWSMHTKHPPTPQTLCSEKLKKQTSWCRSNRESRSLNV